MCGVFDARFVLLEETEHIGLEDRPITAESRGAQPLTLAIARVLLSVAPASTFGALYLVFSKLFRSLELVTAIAPKLPLPFVRPFDPDARLCPCLSICPPVREANPREILGERAGCHEHVATVVAMPHGASNTSNGFRPVG
jgi:hypothetical protein